MKGRRDVRVEDASRWVFNRVAAGYAARPPYPAALIDRIAEFATEGARVADLGAGIGHVAIPLAERGIDVTAVEPADAMLAELRAAAHLRGVRLRALHAAAEALPFADASIDLVVISDALHFMNAELASREVARILAPDGALAVVMVALADTEFMRDLRQLVENASQRRARTGAPALKQLAAITRIPLTLVTTIHDETRVDHDGLERILRSLSFIGPAMNAERFTSLRTRLRALSSEPVFARTLTLHAGRRVTGLSRRARPASVRRRGRS